MESIVQVSPQSSEHWWAIQAVFELLCEAFGEPYLIRSQAPVAVSDLSEPEPDVAVHAGSKDDYLLQHPTTALLAVEVSKSTQQFDKHTKADLYASAAIEDYWVLDLDRRELIVFRKPTQDSASHFCWKSMTTEVIKEQGVVSPLALPKVSLKVADMLPPNPKKRLIFPPRVSTWRRIRFMEEPTTKPTGLIGRWNAIPLYFLIV